MPTTPATMASKISVYYDPHHAAHRGPDSSAECPARVDAVLHHLQSSTIAQYINFQPFAEPFPAPTPWPSDVSRNCAACTMPVKLSHSECGTCGTIQALDHVWRYVGDVSGDTTYETTCTAAVVERASRIVACAAAATIGIRTRTHTRLTLCLTRPPGHHACEGRRVGFCHRNFAIDALDALTAAGLRVAILDVDAHHGDGTEAEVLRRPHAGGAAAPCYVSLHGYGAGVYPGTGADCDGERVTNIALPPGTGTDAWLAALRSRALPALARAVPDVVVLSCGLDGHEEDPVAPWLRLSEAAYAGLGAELAAMRLPVLAVLEGGYATHVLGPCLEALAAPFAAAARCTAAV